MKRKIFSILFALVLVLSMSLMTAVPAAANGGGEPSDAFVFPFELGGKSADNYTAEWDEVTFHGGSSSVHLATTGEVGTGDEARIKIDLSDLPEGEVVTLGVLGSISWYEYLVAGYPPHLDISLDVNGNGTWDGYPDDDILVFEYAYNSEAHAAEGGPTYGAQTEGWYQTFSDDEDGPAVIDNSANAWAGSGPPGPLGGEDFIYGTLADWKAGDVDPSIDADTVVLAFEIEVDNWIVQSEAYIDDIAIDEYLVCGQIQDAIDSVDSSTILVMPGTYIEAVTIPHGVDLAIAGAGRDVTTWIAPVDDSSRMHCIKCNLSGYSAGDTTLDISGFTFSIEDNEISTSGIAILINHAEEANLYLDIYDNQFVETTTIPDETANSMLLCHNRYAGRADGVAPVKIYNNLDDTTGGICMSNTRAFDIYNNVFDGGSDALHIAYGCPTDTTIGDHHIYDNTFMNASNAYPDGPWPAIFFNYHGSGTGMTFLPSTIENNTFEDNDIAVGYNMESDLSYPGDVIAFNDFAGNTEAISVWGDYATTIDAPSNWWGDASGPEQATTNPSGTGDAVSDNVNYCAWLGASYATTPRTYHVNETCTIQSAIDEASSGDTINVAAGTYHESCANYVDIKINKSLSLIGAGSSLTIVELNEGVMDGVSIGASDVLIQGIKFTKRPEADYACGFNIRAGINVETPPPDNTFESITFRDVESEYSYGMNVIFDGVYTYESVTLENCNIHHGGERNFYEAPSVTINGLTITNCHFDDCGQNPTCQDGGPGDPIGFNLQGTTTNLTITGGTFNHNVNDGINIGQVSGATIEDVTVISSASGVGDRSGIAIWDVGVGTSNVEIINPTVTNCGGRGIMFGTWGQTVSNVSVTGGTVSGAGNNGIMLYAGGDGGLVTTITFDGVTITGSGSHNVCICEDDSSGNATVSGVVIEGCAITKAVSNGVFFDGVADVTGSRVNFNNITENDMGVVNTVGMLDATNNWWGDISGPKQATTNPRGEGDEVSANVTYQPWLTRVFETVQAENIAYFGYAWVNLSAGWNIASTPIALDPDADTWGEYVALGDPDLHIHATNPAYSFNAQTGIFELLTGSYQLKPCDAIYVRMSEADIAPILYSPEFSAPTKQLYPGWNLVGLASDNTTMSAKDALTSVYKVAGDLTGYCQVVSPSTGNQNAWIFIRDSAAPDMQRTKGYWVFMVNAPTCTPLAGFTFTPQSLPD